jgi:hypothetical protein
VDPSRPAEQNTILWLACDPDPFNLGRSACTDMDVLKDPSSLAEPGAQTGLPPGMHLIGFNDVAGYTAPADLFSVLPADDERRQIGTVAQVLAIAVAEEVSPLAPPEELRQLFERVRAREVASILSLFRIRVSEDPAVNANPTLGALLVSGEPHPEGATLRARPAEPLSLELTAPDEAFEVYTQLTPTGSEEKTEKLIGAWYSRYGRFSDPRLALRAPAPQIFIAPRPDDAPLPEERSGQLFIVVRDTRGGQSWMQTPTFVCDQSLPAPVVSSVSPTTGLGDGTTLVSFEGQQLASVLDVLVGGKALLGASYSAERDAFEGRVPVLPPGEHAITVRGKHCADAETTLRFTVP